MHVQGYCGCEQPPASWLSWEQKQAKRRQEQQQRRKRRATVKRQVAVEQAKEQQYIESVCHQMTQERQATDQSVDHGTQHQANQDESSDTASETSEAEAGADEDMAGATVQTVAGISRERREAKKQRLKPVKDDIAIMDHQSSTSAEPPTPGHSIKDAGSNGGEQQGNQQGEVRICVSTCQTSARQAQHPEESWSCGADMQHSKMAAELSERQTTESSSSGEEVPLSPDSG